MKFSALLMLWVLLFAVSLGTWQYPISLDMKGRNFTSKILRKIAKFRLAKIFEIPHDKIKFI